MSVHFCHSIAQVGCRREGKGGGEEAGAVTNDSTLASCLLDLILHQGRLVNKLRRNLVL